MKKLYRSEKNKVFAGIIGGLGEYFDIDPVILRAGYIFLCIFTAIIPGVITYILLMFIIPKHNDGPIFRKVDEN